MVSLGKKPEQVEADDVSIFDLTALEIEATLRHERRKKQGEEKANECRNKEEIIVPEQIDVLLMENDHSEPIKTSFFEELTRTNDREKGKTNELSSGTRCRRKAMMFSEEIMLKLDSENTGPPSTLCNRASQSQSNWYANLASKGPFKQPVATTAPVNRYGERRTGVCDAFDETSEARTRCKVMQKRLPDVQNWLLE